MCEKSINFLNHSSDLGKDRENFKNEDPGEGSNDDKNNTDLPIKKPSVNRRPPLLDPYNIDKVTIPFEKPKSPPQKEGNA